MRPHVRTTATVLTFLCLWRHSLWSWKSSTCIVYLLIVRTWCRMRNYVISPSGFEIVWNCWRQLPVWITCRRRSPFLVFLPEQCISPKSWNFEQIAQCCAEFAHFETQKTSWTWKGNRCFLVASFSCIWHFSQRRLRQIQHNHLWPNFQLLLGGSWPRA